MTRQRFVIARILSDADDHPSVSDVHKRAIKIDPSISIATVYRTVRLLEETGILDRHDFKDGFSRFEEATEANHDHLLNIEDATIIEFNNKKIETLKERIAREHGLGLVDHKSDLFAVPISYDEK